MSCAYHYIPFARFRDDLFLQQVDLLRPGTAVPDSSTLSRLTKYAYMEQARHVKAYFEASVRNLAVKSAFIELFCRESARYT